MSDEFIWSEKYRPKKIEDTILPQNLKSVFQAIVTGGELANMIFTGTAGTGKTTVARALCDEMSLDYIIVNASEEGGIDTLRTKIKQFASSISLQGGYKVVILDEADYLNPSSFQPALRGFMEEFSKNCRFILTCNFKNRIIKPLHSRCAVYEFNTSKKDMAKLASKFMERLTFILKTENIEYKDQVVANLIISHAPDWRRIINEAQRLSTEGSIDEHTTLNNSTKYKELMIFLKDKNFKKMRTWIVDNIDTDSSVIFRGIYDEMFTYVEDQSIPNLILILADYQYKASFVADHELNTVACMTELMMEIKFK